MSLFQAIILGIFQGVAEFLPISSSGHLAVLQALFGIKEGNLFFTQMLHLGTLVSIIIVYFDDIYKMIVEFFTLIFDLLKGKKIKKLTMHQKLALFIIIASVPTAVIGLVFEDFFESMFTSILPIGIAFIVTGVLLWVIEKNNSKKKNISKMTPQDALFIGFVQGAAILPGISRSGSTIVAGLFRGLDKSLATRFSFLIAIPATFGAALLGIIDVIKADTAIIIDFPLIVGVTLSAIVGIISIKFLVKILNKNKLHYFSYYLWVVGAITIISQLI